jgi:hypothetical protein
MLQVEAGESRVPLQDRQRALRGLPAPEPAVGLAAYERERELALSRSSECRANCELYLALRRRGAVSKFVVAAWQRLPMAERYPRRGKPVDVVIIDNDPRSSHTRERWPSAAP